MPVIDATQLRKSHGAEPILLDVSLTLRSRENVGLVGNNGCGKSTLGRILAGIEDLDDGSIARRRGAHVDYLPQEPSLPAGQTIQQVVVDSLREWSQAKNRYDEMTESLALGGGELDKLVAAQAGAADEVERLGGWDRLHEAETIVGHLGITDSTRLVDTLSGGERRRVALARVLVHEPDLAILDEPTNHLDISTIEWLEEHLRNRFRGALLLITHDRFILDSVTTRTLELDAGKITSYDGGYAAYLIGKADRQAHAERTERNRQNFLRREVEWLRRGPKARATKQKARIKRAHEVLDTAAPQEEKTAELKISSTRMGKTILETQGLVIERDGRTLVNSLDLALSQGERIGIVGPNGCGKTSFLLALQGELAPTSGDLKIGMHTKIGYLDQGREDLDADKTIREVVAGDTPTIEIDGERIQVGGYLERFLFQHNVQRTKVGVLSGGERARVCLARLLWQRTNLLLLDEPTNDLDVATLGALESMLVDYKGSALIVSHDRWFLDRVATSILSFEDDGRVILHRGNYSQYRARQSQQGSRGRARENKEAGETAAAKVGTTASRGNTPPKGQARKLSFKEKRELDGLFEQIEEAELQVQALTNELADPSTYESRGHTVAELTNNLEVARARVETMSARWEELETIRSGES
jgi:ATP-binding cassette subfamily F protein uup